MFIGRNYYSFLRIKLLIDKKKFRKKNMKPFLIMAYVVKIICGKWVWQVIRQHVRFFPPWSNYPYSICPLFSYFANICFLWANQVARIIPLNNLLRRDPQIIMSGEFYNSWMWDGGKFLSRGRWVEGT